MITKLINKSIAYVVSFTARENSAVKWSLKLDNGFQVHHATVFADGGMALNHNNTKGYKAIEANDNLGVIIWALCEGELKDENGKVIKPQDGLQVELIAYAQDGPFGRRKEPKILSTKLSAKAADRKERGVNKQGKPIVKGLPQVSAEAECAG